MVALFFADMPPAVQDLVQHLDLELAVRNPGLHYVQRSMYVGFRREEVPPRAVGGKGRSQVFASVRAVPRKQAIAVTLPREPHDVPLDHNMRDVSGTGHHGVGDVEVLIRSLDDINDMLVRFSDWLISPVTLKSSATPSKEN